MKKWCCKSQCKKVTVIWSNLFLDRWKNKFKRIFLCEKHSLSIVDDNLVWAAAVNTDVYERNHTKNCGNESK